MRLANEVDVDLQLRGVTLREFDFSLAPLWPLEPSDPVDGLELRLRARDTGLVVSLRFERGEFVNIATAGLTMLDAADAATETNGGGE